MNESKTLLVVDDNKDILSAVRLLMRNRVEVVTASTPDSIPDLLRRHHPQVVLLDMNFRAVINSGNEGLYWLSEIRRLSPQTAVILFTAYADVNLAVEGMKQGAVDFVVKPFENDTLTEAILKAFKGKGSRPGTPSPRMLWGESAVMTNLRGIVGRVAATDANILITGENGTGKDLLAREIHRMSLRSAGPMETVDMGAVTDTLFESELYGHVKGAFTDARADRAGKFETAHGGTLFLDEIGNLPYHLQAKLLTSLQQRQVVRVGSNVPRSIDIRLICATNLDLPMMVRGGSFRQDLYYRINTVELQLPPLRSRQEDIPLFVNLFLDKYAKVYGKEVPEVSADAMRRLQSRPWPGNIRQLEHAVEKALILCDGASLGVADFDLFDEPSTAGATPGGTLEEMERNAIASAIRQHGGNLAEVARKLGITRQTLYNKIRKYGL
jgi:DNA-binding NtrC family response regulator